MSEGRTIFIAGATGYLGKFMVKECLTRGYNVVVLTRSKARFPKELQAFADESSTSNGASNGHSNGASVCKGSLRVVEGEVTKVETLKGLLDGADVIFSSIGITKQQDKGVTYMDVDFGANYNLLQEAQRDLTSEPQNGQQKRSKTFIYTHVLNAEKIDHVELIHAKNKFVQALQASKVRPCVVCPSGFYSDLEEVLDMAFGGRCYLFGDGKELVSPIAGADLAPAVMDIYERGDEWASIGGPETMSFRQVAERAKQAVEEGMPGKKVAISSVPRSFTNVVVWMLTKVSSQKTYGPVHFIHEASKHNMDAPHYGSKLLLDHYREKVKEQAEKEKAKAAGCWSC